MFLPVSLSKQIFSLVSHSCRSSSTLVVSVALVLHSCHSSRSRVACVWHSYCKLDQIFINNSRLFQVIKERANTNASVELFPIQIFIYKHTIPPKSTGFSLNSFGINNLMSQFFGSAHNNTSNQQEQHPVVLTPKRTLTYRASFSKKNTMRQASFCVLPNREMFVQN